MLGTLSAYKTSWDLFRDTIKLLRNSVILSVFAFEKCLFYSWFLPTVEWNPFECFTAHVLWGFPVWLLEAGTALAFYECWALFPLIVPGGSFLRCFPHTNVLIITQYLRRTPADHLLVWVQCFAKIILYILSVVLGRRVILVLVSPSWSEVEILLIIYFLNI